MAPSRTGSPDRQSRRSGNSSPEYASLPIADSSVAVEERTVGDPHTLSLGTRLVCAVHVAFTLGSLAYWFLYAPYTPQWFSVVFVICMCMTLWAYWSCILINPGSPDSNWRPQGQSISYQGPDMIVDGHRYPFCTKCNTFKPQRCHHCNVLNRCILRMDHYCVFTRNCIGLNNYKHFVHFLCFGSMLGLTYLIGLGYGVYHASYSGGEVLLLVAATLMCLPMFGMVTMFAGWHLKMMASNLTSIEYYERSSAIGRRLWRKQYAEPSDDEMSSDGEEEGENDSDAQKKIPQEVWNVAMQIRAFGKKVKNVLRGLDRSGLKLLESAPAPTDLEHKPHKYDIGCYHNYAEVCGPMYALACTLPISCRDVSMASDPNSAMHGSHGGSSGWFGWPDRLCGHQKNGAIPLATSEGDVGSEFLQGFRYLWNPWYVREYSERCAQRQEAVALLQQNAMDAGRVEQQLRDAGVDAREVLAVSTNDFNEALHKILAQPVVVEYNSDDDAATGVLGFP